MERNRNHKPSQHRHQKPHPHQRKNSARRRPVRRELSAGGVAVRKENDAWLVAILKTEHKRGEVWVLPKGHVELHQNERVSDAARREVEEEAGLRDLSVKDELGITRYTFQAEEALIHKKVHYFLMTTQQKQLTPQAEESILAAEWRPLDAAISILEYDTDKEIVQRARQRLLGSRLTPPIQQSKRRPPRKHGRTIRVHT